MPSETPGLVAFQPPSGAGLVQAAGLSQVVEEAMVSGHAQHLSHR